MESLAKVMELGYCRCRSEVDYISFQKANDTVKGVTARGRDLIKVGFSGAIKLAPALSKTVPQSVGT
ncbi:hypothetical protein TNCT_445991 [Trichonephila clavata]|uniref:Uncharacterized protein n=1 Tax=Trichonephila clavata TaxID=2740835 RepID=A0A8X6LHU7_TRICU|nr:hypothetical protein TNCT_445991 [Trichonephila clavata]